MTRTKQKTAHITIFNTVKHVLKGHLFGQIKHVFLDRWPLKIGSIHMIFSMTRQEKGDL